jgi:hypothetical protein
MSIIHDMEQGTPEWLAARLGIPTASEFHRIITAAKGELSKQARKYAQQLVAETLLGEPLDTGIGNLELVARGRLLEPLAVQQYEAATGTETRAVGFITTNDGRVGCSPDRLIGQRGGLEIKCPAPLTHMGYLIDGPGDDHKQQVQGQLAVAELEWVDLYSFHPDLPPAKIRTYRDEPYIAKMSMALAEFLDMRDAMLAKATADGWQPRDKIAQPATFGAIKLAA